MPGFDRGLIQAFEDQLDPARPEEGAIPAVVIGYGEMSCVLQIEPYEELVFKRMAGFESREQMATYRGVIEDYCAILREIGIELTETGYCEVRSRRGEFSLYLVQPRIPREELGNARLAELEGADLERLVLDTLRALDILWGRNLEKSPAERIGLDGQISNWAYRHDGDGFALTYFDVGTPFIRRHGEERLDGEVHMKAMPFFLRGIVRHFFMQGVLDRYYDLRLVLIDFLGNFHKEGHSGKIDPGLEIVNTYLQDEGARFGLAPISRKEIDRYYKEDAFIWTVFLAFRRFDRFLATKLLRKRYNYILPGKIER